MFLLNNKNLIINKKKQKEIQNLERVRESMAKELVNLSNKLEFMQQQLREYPSLQENYKVFTFTLNYK